MAAQNRGLFGRVLDFGRNLFGGGQRPQITPQAASTQRPVQQSREPVGQSRAFASNFIGPLPFGGVREPAGQVLGAQTTPQFGGGGAPAGAPAAPSGQGQIPLEQAPEGPAPIDFDALIQPGLEALGQAEEAARGLFSASESGIEAGRAGAVSAAEQAQKTGEQQVSAQEGKESRRAEGAVGEQRRGFAQIARNLRSRFGSSISTGLGAESIAGAQTLRNIGNIRAGLSEVINDLNTRKQTLQDISQNAIREAEANAVTQKNSARASLQAALADIGAQRGQLQSRRAELVFQAVEGFRQTVVEVNARNTAFQQQLFQQQQAAQLSLDNAIARANATSEKLPTVDLSPGQTKLLSLESLGLGGAQQEEIDSFGQNLPGGVQFGTAGQFGAFSAPKTEEDKLANPFR